MVERVEPARDEGIVERPDGEERRARQLAREPESAEQKEEVVLGDPELDVLARGRLLPLDRERQIGERGRLRRREVHVLPVDPSREVRRHRDIG